ncbi:MAG TPA: dihydrolipoyl dehydrogenase [bacterium]|nr:dihydrolipoyl dehydrogenase [bacterium]
MDYDVCVIGAGPGGYVAAIRAAQLKLKTCVIERAKAGGICTNWGCIPSKALLHGAGIMHTLKHAKDYGITINGDIKVDFAQLRAKKDRVIGRLVGGVELLLKKNGVDWVGGEAVFVNANEVSVKLKDGGTRAIKAKNFIIATGARPIELPHLKPDGQSILTYVEALEIDGPPRDFVVIGGGAIGLEMAEVYAAFGSQVTVVEMMPTLLPGFDADLTKAAADIMRKAGIKALTATKVASAQKGKDGRWNLALESADAGAAGKQGDTLVADKVLVSIGLRPNSENLGLEKAGVKLDQKGFIIVDETMRTSARNIYAIGDIVGKKLLAHKASREGHIAAENIAGHNVAMDYRALPGTVFTHPEIATVGLSEEEAKKAGHDVAVGKFPVSVLGRSVATTTNEGLVKIVADRKTDRILGVHIVAPTAGDLIAEAALAIEMDATPEDLAATIHVHPTFSEATMEAAADVHGAAVHVAK